MKQTNKRLAFKKWVKYNLSFSIYEIAFSGLFVAMWVVSALPIFSINFGFMKMGITYVWPILLGLSTKPLIAFVCSIIGDNLALLSSGTGFAQWMIEYAIISPFIVLICLLFKKLIKSNKQRDWLIVVVVANVVVLIGTLCTMIIENSFTKVSRNPESAFDFKSGVAKILVWSVYSFMLITSITLMFLYLLACKNKPLRVNYISFVNKKISIRHKLITLDAKKIKEIISFYSLSMIVIVVTIWIWGPFAQIRYLNVYGKIPNQHSYKEYDLFLIPRILKTPISLLLYTVIIIPIYKVSEICIKRFAPENRW